MSSTSTQIYHPPPLQDSSNILDLDLHLNLDQDQYRSKSTFPNSLAPTEMSCPWGKISAPVQYSLADVMSEQLASELDRKQDLDVDLNEAIKLSLSSQNHTEIKRSDASAAVPDLLNDAELAAKLAAEELGGNPNDELLARYLQKQFDEEYDSFVQKKEEKYNGSSKVSISFENYKMKHQRQDNEALIEDDDDDDYEKEFPEFPKSTNWELATPTISSKGYCGQGKDIVTKHDKVLCGRRNAERLMTLPPGFDIGDGEGMDMQLPNHVYNNLKTHSLQENKKSHRVHEKKDHSTATKAVDEKTRIILFKLVNSGYLASIGGEVSKGKEAMVFKATGGTFHEKELPTDIILKIYKTTLSEFKTRAKYIYGDHILSKDKFNKQNPRKIMRIWAEKEYLNLRRMCRQGLPCPTPLTLKKHVLAMTCIGGEHPAPKLKDANLSPEDLQDAYEQTVELIKNLYHKCRLVHADLSEYNLLWHEDKVWVIDVSQSVEPENSNSHEFLLRDCHNVCSFFHQAGVHGVKKAEELFMDVTNYSLQGDGKVFTAQVQRYEKDSFAFDYFFEQSEALNAQDLEEESSDSEGEGEEWKTEGQGETQAAVCDEASTASKETSIAPVDRWEIDCSDCS